jgi:hypothetical protein
LTYEGRASTIGGAECRADRIDAEVPSRLPDSELSMPSLRRCAAALLALSASVASAQASFVDFPDNVLTNGSSNTHPFNVNQTAGAAGFTQFVAYPGLSTPTNPVSLQSAGVIPGQILTSINVVPFTAGSGTYSAPNFFLWVGHLSATQSPSGWINNLDSPVLLWDWTVDGPMTFPWVSSTYSSVPIRPGALFQWDGVRDIGFLIAAGPGATGSTGQFTVRSSPTNSYVRHGTTTFNAAPGTAQTTTGTLGMRIGLGWAPGFVQVANTTGGGVGDLTLGLVNMPANAAFGYTFITAYTAGNLGAGPFFGLVPDATTWAILQTPTSVGNPLAWVPGFGFYPDVNFVVPPGVLSFLGGQSWRLCTAAFDINQTFISRTNVVQLNW